MKRFISLISMVAVALGMVSCNRTEQDAEEVVRFASVPVSLSDGEGDQFAFGDTRSQVSIDSEEFVSAYLFAFDATTKKVLSYPTTWEDHQGENGGVVAIFTEEANFDWALPFEKAFDVWAVVNPGTQYEAFLNSCLTNSNLTENNLYGEAMVFSCPSSSALKQLDVETMGTGIPMSGRLDNQTLLSATQGITIPVEHLFAKYEIRFGFDDYVAQNYTVNAWAIRASKSNTEVPFFWNGDFSQTNPSKLNVVDYGTLNDLVSLNQGERATLYFLENCHGTKSGVRDWNTVYEDLNSNNPDLDYCSYIEVAVNVTRQATSTTPAVDESNIHRIYVGDTFLNRTAGTYNFDVKRNMYRKIKINLGPGTPEAAFKFTNSSTLTIVPGETVTVPFVCKGIDNPEFTSSNVAELFYDHSTFIPTSTTIDGVTYTHSGTVTYGASNDANGDYLITGGKNLGTEYETKGTADVNAAQETTVRYAISVEGTNYTNSTKNTITLYPYLVRYENDVVVSKTRLTSGVSWVSMPYDWEARRHANVSNSSGAAVVTYNYAFNNYESTSILNFPITCTYTYNGEVLTGSTVATFGETHFIKAWRMMKDSNHNWLTCPYVVLSEPCPELWNDRYEINVLVNYSPGLVTGDSGYNGYRTYQIQGGATTWPSAGNPTEGPSYIFPSNAQTDYQIGNFVFNQNGSPTEYYDSVDKIYYYLIAQGQEYHDVAQQNTIPSSYYVRIIPHSIWVDGKQKFTREYSLIIGTDYQEKYEIPHMSSSGRTSQVLVPTASGNNYEYRNIEDVIDYIEVKSSLGTVELHPSSSSVTHSDHFMYWGQFGNLSMYTYIYGPGDNCVVYSNSSSVMWNNVSMVELKWKYPYGRNYETRVSIMTFDGLNYSSF